jgi:uncharacterized protein YigA (DUF484 family)
MDESLKEKMIAYLNTHPEFLLQNKELLTEVLLPHPVADHPSGNVVSLVEVQTKIQRDQIHDLKDTLKTQVTDSNHLLEALQSIRNNLPCFHESYPITEAYEFFFRTLKYNFSATEVRCILFMPTPFPAVLRESGLILTNNNDKRKIFLLELFHRKKALCGVLQEEIMSLMFGKDHSDLSSTMLYPVNIGQHDALIALASQERNRYGIGIELEVICMFCDIFAHYLENILIEDADDSLLETSI